MFLRLLHGSVLLRAAPRWLLRLPAAHPCRSPLRLSRSGTGLMVSEISFGTMTFSDVDKAATGSGRGDSGEAAYAMLEACYKVRAVPPRAHIF